MPTSSSSTPGYLSCNALLIVASIAILVRVRSLPISDAFQPPHPWRMTRPSARHPKSWGFAFQPLPVQPLRSAKPADVFPQVSSNETDCAVPPGTSQDDECTLTTTTTTTVTELNEAPEEFQGLGDDGEDDDLHWFRFGGVGRLYENDENPEEAVLDRLKHATVAVVGLGGVGSWTAEALCRSGIGNLVLIDLDDICISNTNRQLHTLSTNVGSMKTDVMRDRLVAIHPFCNITLIHDFVMLDNVQEIVGDNLKKLKVDVVIDAIDGDEEKAALVAACADHSIPVLTTGSPAGKSDPTQIACDDLTRVRGDNLVRACRDRLVSDFNFALQLEDGNLSEQQSPWNIPCVYSKQAGKKSSDSTEFVGGDRVSSFRCDGSLGTACFVTGTFGFVAASRVIEMIVDKNLVPPNRG